MGVAVADWAGFWAACIAGVIVMTGLLTIVGLRVRAYQRRLVVQSTMTAAGFHVVTRSGRRQEIHLDEVKSVTIVTEEGPLDTLAWWEVKLVSGQVFEFAGYQGSREFMEKLRSLPGFDNEALDKAGTSWKSARYVCWKRGRSGVK
jgi:hypothetical protein